MGLTSDALRPRPACCNHLSGGTRQTVPLNVKKYHSRGGSIGVQSTRRDRRSPKFSTRMPVALIAITETYSPRLSNGSPFLRVYQDLIAIRSPGCVESTRSPYDFCGTAFPNPVLDKPLGLVVYTAKRSTDETKRGADSPIEQSFSVFSVSLLMCGGGLGAVHCRFSAVLVQSGKPLRQQKPRHGNADDQQDEQRGSDYAKPNCQLSRPPVRGPLLAVRLLHLRIRLSAGGCGVPGLVPFPLQFVCAPLQFPHGSGCDGLVFGSGWYHAEPG